MPNYLVESYLPRGRADELPGAVERARAAAEVIAARGALVRHVGSTFLPEDEVCLHLFDADSAALVREASKRAGIAAERVVEALPVAAASAEPNPDAAPAATHRRWDE